MYKVINIIIYYNTYYNTYYNVLCIKNNWRINFFSILVKKIHSADTK